MKKIFIYIALASFIVLVILGIVLKDTRYSLIGFSIVTIILFAYIFIEFYKYYENKRQLTSVCLTLGRDGLVSKIVNFILLTYFILKGILNAQFNSSTIIESILIIILLVLAVIELYITIFHTPKLSTNGFLCSDGKFIPFNEIKSIKSEDGPMLRHKKLIVEYENNLEQSFKVDNFDYEKVKEHLRMYGAFILIEI